jgi:hypothetical protein
MKTRHRIALLCLIGALAIFYAGARLQPRWVWNAAYWLLLTIGLLSLIRGSLRRTRR